MQIRQRGGTGFIPNPKLKLLDQASEVMRFKHYSIRTERTYREWIKRFIFFHGKRHPREMGAVEVERFFGADVQRAGGLAGREPLHHVQVIHFVVSRMDALLDAIQRQPRKVPK
jgi:Phage integrase, N-terminal SAM-like domain